MALYFNFKKGFLPLRSLLLLFPFLLWAQDNSLNGLSYDKIWLDQGLSQSIVWSIEQDNKGFMWFGTDDGLNRFDGYSIKVFKNNPSDTASLVNNTIISLLGENDGSLWVGTVNGGLDRYDIADNKFYHHRHMKNNPATLSDNRILCLFDDPAGNTWVGTNNGLNVYDKKSGKFKRIFLDEKEPALQRIHIKAICSDNSGRLFIGTSSGSFRLSYTDPFNEQVRVESFHHKDNDPKTIAYDDIRSLALDRNSILWIGTWGRS